MFKNIDRHEKIFVIILIIFIFFIGLIPNSFSKNEDKYSIRAKAKVISVDNSQVFQKGIIKTGAQEVNLEIISGKFNGKRVTAHNYLKGQLEIDKMFQPGDNALVVLGNNNGIITYANIIDHYRINFEIFLFLIFIAILILVSGWTGIKSVISFIFTVIMIWKILIPAFLSGYNPVVVSIFITTIIIATTIILVAGFNERAIAAFLGAFIGIILTCIFSIIFGKLFKVHGAVMPFIETLLYSGYGGLDITGIFLSGIFISSSGAIMDVTMDISVSVSEIVEKKPDILRKEAIKSGMSISKAVIGTMTTTLLLAYSGGYTGLLMVFMAQGTPILNMLNLNYVAAEIMHTVVGSFGLVLVAPITAVISGFIFTHKK